MSTSDKYDDSIQIEMIEFNKPKPLDDSYYYQLYLEHYQNFTDGTVPQGGSSLGELYISSQHLLMAVQLGNSKAQAIAKKLARKFLSHDLPKVSELRFLDDLGAIPPESPHYPEAKNLSFVLQYSKRYKTVYSDYQQRLQEITSALTSAQMVTREKRHPFIEEFFKQVIPDYPCEIDAGKLAAAAWSMLAKELMGEDPLFEVMQQHKQTKAQVPRPQDNYPFRLLPRNDLEKLLAEICKGDSYTVSEVVQRIHDHTETVVTKIPCRARKSKQYELQISAEQLRNNPKAIICFVDEKTGIEIARFKLSEGEIQFRGYGDSIHLKINGALDIPVCIFDNPGADLALTADWVTEKPVYLGGDVNRLMYKGNIQTKQEARIDFSGKVEVIPGSEIQADKQIGLRANEFEMAGRMVSQTFCQLNVHAAVVMAPESECSSELGTIISAGSLKDIRGRFVSNSFIKIDSSDSVYLHGAAELHAKSGLTVNTKSLMSTDKASVKTEGVVLINATDSVVIDKQSAWSAPIIDIHDRTFKNYSPHFSAKKASIRSEDETVNYPSGTITTEDSLQLTGGSAWNGGHIKYGSSFRTKLNKMFVHGIADPSELWNVSKIVNQASLEGGDASVVAGLAVNVLGLMNVRALSLAAIAEINLGFTADKSSRKSRLFALDLGIDVPNIAQTYKDISQLFNKIKNGDYQSVLKVLFSLDSAINAASFGRWVLRTLNPGVGKIADLAWSTLLLICSSPELYRECKGLYIRGEKVESSDIYSLIAKTSNFANQAVSLEAQMESVHQDYTHQGSESKAGDTLPLVNESKPELMDVLPALALDFASLFLPSSTDESIVGVRVGGVHSNATLLHRTGFSYEFWSTQVGLNVTEMFYDSSQQSGITVVGSVSEIGRNLDQSGTTVAFMETTNVLEQKETGTTYAHRVDWRNTNLDEKGTVVAKEIHATSTGHLVHDGIMMGENAVTLSGSTVTTGAESHTESKDGVVSITADYATIAGTEVAQTVITHTTEATTVAATAHITGEKVAMDGGKKTDIHGSLHATGVSHEVTSADGKTSMDPVLSIHGTTVTMSSDSELKAEQGLAVVTADQAMLAGTEDAKNVVIKATESTTIAATAHITGVEVGIDGGKHVDIQGSAHATGVSHEVTSADGKTGVSSVLSIHGATVTTGSGSELKAEQDIAEIYADQVALAGTEEAKSVVVQVTQLATVAAGAHITGEEVMISGEKAVIDLQGSINATGVSQQITSVDGKTYMNSALSIDGDTVTTGIDSELKAEQGQAEITANHATIAGAEKAQSVVTHTSQSTVIAKSAHVIGGKVDLDGGTKADIQGEVIATDESKEEVSADGTSSINLALKIAGNTVTASQESVIEAEQGYGLITGNQLNLAGDAKAAVLHVKANTHLDIAEPAHLRSTLPNGAVILEAPTGLVKGYVDAREVDFKIDHEVDIEDLLLRNGIYKNVTPGAALNIWTQDKIILNKAIDLPISYTLSGTSVDVNAYLHSQHDINLVATEGDVRTNAITVRADGTLAITAQGSYYNQKGNISGNKFFVHVEKNVINTAGTLKGDTYLQIEAAHGNIEDRSLEHDVHGRFDITKQYDIGHMLGGTGIGYDGVGFYAHAGGKFINDASEVSSRGSNYISGDNGVDTTARSHRYVSFYRYDKSWWGKETEKRDIATQVQPSLIYSANGKNTIISKEGGIYSCATKFIAPGQTILSGKENVRLTGIIAETKHYESSSNLWGAISSKKTQLDQYAVPTQVVSQSDIHIMSLQDAVLSSAAIYTPGQVEFSVNKVIVSAPILQHSQTEDSRTFGIQGPQFPCHGDLPMYNSVNSLSQSQGSAEWAANAWNATIDGANTFNGLVSAYRSGSLAQAIFPTSSMTAASFNYTHTHARSDWQTIAPNVGIQCGSLAVGAKDTVDFINGVHIHVAGDASIHAKKFIQRGVALSSTMRTQSEATNVGSSVDLDPTVGVCSSRTGTKSTTYANQLFQVGGKLQLSVGEWDIDAANTVAGKLSGYANTLSVTSRSDTSSSYSRSVQASSNGSFAYQQSSGRSAKIGIVSGIEVLGDTDFVTDSAHLTGGRLLFDRTNGFKAQSVLSESVSQYNRSSSFGICGNVNYLLDDTSSWSWNRAIPTLGIQSGKQDCQIEQRSTLWSTQGGLPGVQSVKGDLATDQSGSQVLRDEQHCYQIKIPLSHPDGLKQLRENAAWLGNQMHAEQRPSSQADVPAYLRQSVHVATGHSSQSKISQASSKSRSSSGDEASYQEQEADGFDATLEKAEKIASKPLPGTSLDSHRTRERDLRMFGQYAREAESDSAYETKMAAHKERERSEAKATRLERWGTGQSSSSKWRQEFWDGVDDLVRQDEAVVHVMDEIGQEIDPRNIWAEMKRDSADLDRRVANGELFSRKALGDVVRLGAEVVSVAPVGRGVRLVGEGLAAGVAKFGFWEKEAFVSESDVFHAVKSSEEGQNVINGINPRFFKAKNRFGKAFYVAEVDGTAVSEVASHGKLVTDAIRFSFNNKEARVLDLANAKIAKAWGYDGGEITESIRNIGIMAKDAGFDAIRFESERGSGVNLAILKNFDRLLKPQMVVPVPRIISSRFH